jgi:glutamate racemase
MAGGFPMSSDSPIVVLDSGLGGLTVARALRHTLPHEDIVYFGDTARLPYGLKTRETVTAFVRQIIEYLRPFHPKHIVIACNTATALAMQAVKEQFADLSISGVIDPGARAAVAAAGAKQYPVIGILATDATIRSQAYERAIIRRRGRARLLLRPAPLLVPIIEDGRPEDDPLVRVALKQYLEPMVRRGMDVLVLGCTHYPMYKDVIQRMVGAKVKVIDSADRCAEDVEKRLRTYGLLRSGADLATGRSGAIRCFVTDDSPRFMTLASRFMGEELDPPTWVSVEELYELGRRMVLKAG